MTPLDQIKKCIDRYKMFYGHYINIEQNIHTDMSFCGFPSFVQLDTTLITCKACKHSQKDGTLCCLFANYAPIAGGDEYEEVPAVVEPDGFCAWAERMEA